MKKLIFLLLILSVTVAHAADTELQDLAELVAIAGTDVLYVVDDPAGVPASRKITATNLFDIIDTFAELNTITADETLVSEEGTPTLDALWTFDLGLTITTGDPLIFGVNRIDDGADLLDGEMISAGTIDDDPIDWSDCTLADFDFETADRMFHSDNAGDVQEIVLGADTTFLESNGAAAAPAFRAIADGDIPDTITIDLATLATTVTVTDDEASNDDQEIVFTTDNTNLESDGDFHYSPDTGTVTATEFIGGGAGITGTLTAYDDIADPDAASSITFQDGETVTWATEEDSAGSFFLIQDSDAALAANTYLLDLDYSVDDNEANADYLRCQDAGGVVFSIQQNGDTASTGNIEGATITEGGQAVPNDTDHLGFFGGTTSAQLLAEISNETGTGLAVFATAPVFTTSIQLTGADADPAAAAGTIVYDNTIAVMSGGGLRWYDNDSVRLIVDLETDPSNDDYVVAYDAAADGFYMKVDAGVSTAWDDIGDPDNGAATTITFDNAETTIFTGDNDAAVSFFTIQNSDGDHTGGNIWLLDLDYSADDGDADADFIKCQDSGGTVFSVSADGVIAGGNTTITGSLEATSLTEGLIAVPNINELDWIDEDQMADSDHGDVEWSGGGALVQAATIADTVYASCYVGLFQAATGNNEPFYTDGALTYDATSGTLSATQFVGGGLGGFTAWDDITDPDLAATIDFVTFTQTIDIGVTDTGGPKSGLILDVTGLGAGVTDVIALEITTATDDDTDFIPLEIRDDSGAANDLLFQIDSTGEVYSDAGYATQGGVVVSGQFANTLDLTGNSDVFEVYFGGTDVDVAWSDGVLNFRNNEDGVDAIVEIEGKDNGEKGILRVLSDGDDKHIELHHDDTDGHIITNTGDIHIEPAGGDVSLAANNLDTTGNVDFGGADLEIPQAAPAVPDADGEIEYDFTDGKLVIQHGSAHAELGASTDVAVAGLIRSWGGTIVEPDGINDVMTVKAINSIEFPHGVVITAVYLGVSEDSDYTLTVQNFDDFDTINAGNPTIDTVAYSNDTTGEIIDTTPTYATIAAGQIIMISIPATDVDWIHFEIYYYEPAA